MSTTSPRSRSNRRRDADEEALQAALQESMQPDFLAQILQSESQHTAHPPSLSLSPAVPTGVITMTDTTQAPEDLAAAIEDPVDLTDEENGDTDDDITTEHPPLLGMADYMLLHLLYYIDEESLCQCFFVCKRLGYIAKTDSLFETLCRRIFPIQCPRLRRSNHLALRKFPTWFSMFANRPRVRYYGFYWYKTVYYKKPELNMWTDIVPGTVLQVVYYRYFSFQRDGSVLYAMSFKPPFQAGLILQQRKNEVYRGRFEVDRDHVEVSIPTSHSVVEFRFQLDESSHEHRRGMNVRLILQAHCSFTEPDRTGWVEHFDTCEEQADFYRYWDL